MKLDGFGIMVKDMAGEARFPMLARFCEPCQYRKYIWNSTGYRPALAWGVGM